MAATIMDHQQPLEPCNGSSLKGHWDDSLKMKTFLGRTQLFAASTVNALDGQSHKRMPCLMWIE